MIEKRLKPEQAHAALCILTADQIDAAVGEIQRERLVRERCFPRWVEEGKLSRIDAKDRLDRQILAEEILLLVLDSLPFLREPLTALHRGVEKEAQKRD